MDTNRFHRRIEIAKLIASIAVPVAIALCGYYLQRSISEYESHQEVSKVIFTKLAEKRLSLYDSIKEPLNDIYCYIEETCDWEKDSAIKIKEIRKLTNKIMYSNRAVWSPETFNLYTLYVDVVAFQLSAVGESKIRAEVNPVRKASINWTDESNVLLTGEKSPEHRLIYNQLIDALSADISLKGVGQ